MTKRMQQLAVLSVFAIAMAMSTQAHAQNNAVVFGEVTDVANGNAPVPDAIVVVTSPNLQGEQTTLSDERGLYRIDQLPAGDYTVKVVAPGFQDFSIGGVRLLLGREVKVPVTLLPVTITASEIQVTQITSSIDQGSATTGLTVAKDYMDKVTTKRSFEAVTEATPGAQVDQYGISFSGSTSPENNIQIDGMMISSSAYATNGLALPPEFFDQIDIKTGGYLPEYGNAMGGFVNAVTKMGGNEIHGSVFSYTTPLRLRAIQIGRSGEAISGDTQLNIRQELGFEVGGAIVKDKLWFHVGFAPRLQSLTLNKQYRRQVDRDGDGIPDTGPDGAPVVENLNQYNTRNSQFEQIYAYTAKLTFNANENHRISLSTTGNPTFSSGYHPDFGTAGLNGDASTFNMGRRSGSYTGVLDYDGKFLDKKLLVNLKAGYAQTESLDLIPRAGNGVSIIYLERLSLDQFDPAVAADCGTFDNGDPRCPVTNYTTGGIGFNTYQRSERWTARGTVSYLLKALGTHQLKAGFEYQRGSFYNRRGYTGGAVLEDFGGGLLLDYRRYGYLANPDDPLNEASADYRNPWINSTFYNNYAAFLQDSWSIDRINLNINGGVRIDAQELFGPATQFGPGAQYNKYLSLTNLAPRVGAVWDFLGNGRSKIFASYGRFYQLVPLGLMDRAFPSEPNIGTFRQKDGVCDADPLTCAPVDRYTFGGTPTEIVNPVRGQFVDTITAGAEYQVLNDLLVGMSYVHTEFGDVIEDFSADDGYNYKVGNPGVGPAAEVLGVDRVTGAETVVRFPKPQRRYDSLNIFLTKSLARNFIVQGSYTLSFLRGHYAGLFRPEDGQLDPNLNSDLDLVDLLDNRYGALPSDRTHQFKIDGAYVFMVSERFAIIPNLVMRVASGTPYSYTGPHLFYGPEQAFILTRGMAGRTDPAFQADLGLKGEYAFSKDTRLTIGLVVINVGSVQLATRVDQRYVRDDQILVPIAGGDQGDLRFLKTLDNQPAVLNPNFASATTRQLPMEMRVDVKLTF